MGSDYHSLWKKSPLSGLINVEDEEELKTVSSLPIIPQPQTPQEPIEFLSRSWSLSASEISKALALKQKQSCPDKSPNTIPEPTFAPPMQQSKVKKHVHARRAVSIGNWFHHKEPSYNTVKRKDRIRAENARLHSALSIAGLAAALAAVASAENSSDSDSKMAIALASATELLASHCIEMAETEGVDHDRVASVVRSAVDIQSPSDLMTLTAAAATALRGEAALKARLPKEARKNAAISPYETNSEAAVYKPQVEHCSPCVGELLQLTTKGVVQWKHVTVYINKKSQVIIELKSKHVGGAFSKKNKSVVYGVCDETAAWPYRRERETSEEVCFGLKTAQGFLEFKCKNKILKQTWVDGIQNLLRRISCTEATECSLGFLTISDSI